MNIAILIDAENIDPAYAEQIFAYAESKGSIVKKEIYGAGTALNEWSDAIFRYALHANMTLKPSRFKNSTDIALAIGAMDLLVERATHGAIIDTAIIVSSDSDYSALALRLRSSGMEVIGIGQEGRVNPAWPMACSGFVALAPADEPRQEDRPKPDAASRRKEDPQAASRGAKPVPAHRRHAARVAAIWRFISGELSRNNGHMASAALFSLLNGLPDYLYDQQKSKRTPVDYLNRQYGDLLKIQKNPDGALWVYSKAAGAIMKPEDGDAAPREEAPPQEDPQDAEGAPLPLVGFLRGEGVDEADARAVSSVYERHSNMRDVYNALRKTFKAEAGASYYKLVKRYKEKEGRNASF